MKTVNYIIPVNEPDGDGSVTVYELQITGTRKQRKREFRKYVKAAFGITNASGLARQMGFRDLT